MNTNEELKNKAIKSSSSKIIEKFLTLGIQLAVSIVLARLLSPDDYGIIALINVFIAISTVFIEYGFGIGLVQRKSISRVDVNTVFISGFISSAFLYAIIFLFSPLIADFYNEEAITSVLRVYAVTIIIGSLISVPNSLLSRELKHSKQIIPTLISCTVSGVLGIVLAYSGYGVWALVAQQLAQKLIYLIIIEMIVKYVPRAEFSFVSFKNVFGFTWKIVLTRLISTFSDEIRNLLIAKQYDSSQLGFYSKGNQLPSTVVTATDYSISTVMFSVFSKKQDNISELKSMVRRTLKTNFFLLFPMMFGLIAVSKPLVLFLLTEKWLPSVPFMQIACLGFCIQPFISINEQAINSIGRSKTTLIIEIARRTVSIALVVGSVFISVEAVAWSFVIANVLSCVLYGFVSRSILKYGFREQLFDMLPILLVSLVMFASVFSLHLLPLEGVVLLLLQVVLGIVVYLGVSVLIKSEPLLYCVNFVKNKIRKRKETPVE